MDIQGKRDFLHELLHNVKTDIMKAIPKMPEDWDGIELRWYVAEKFGEVVDPTARHEHKKRYREYRYFVFGKGL